MAVEADILMIHDNSHNVETFCLNETGYRAMDYRSPIMLGHYIANERERNWKLEGVRVAHCNCRKAQPAARSTTMDLLSMWIGGKHDELFATLREMPFIQRVRKVRGLCRQMADFDDFNADDDFQPDELPRFLDECIARL